MLVFNLSSFILWNLQPLTDTDVLVVLEDLLETRLASPAERCIVVANATSETVLAVYKNYYGT